MGSEVKGALPSLCLEPAQKAKPITSIEQWTTAFQIFVGVYTAKFPQEAPALMKYGEVVRDLAVRGANWRYYDSNFRYLRQQKSNEFSWGNTHWELWIRSQNFQVNQSRQMPNDDTKRVPNIPRGYCVKFHLGKFCSGCYYKHQCPKCGRVHPRIKCLFRGEGSAGNQSNNASIAGPSTQAAQTCQRP